MLIGSFTDNMTGRLMHILYVVSIIHCILFFFFISSPQHLPFYCFIYKQGEVNWENRGKESVWAIQMWSGSWVNLHHEGRLVYLFPAP